MKHFKAALFDLDGTLIDTEGQYSIYWGRVCRKFRPDIEGLEYKIKGMTLVQIFDRYFPDPAVQQEIREGLDAWELQMDYRWLPGALDFIRDCRRQGVKCAIVTSSNQQKMKAIPNKLPEFYSLFDRVLTSEDFTASKPAPDCYLLGARVFGLDLHECVVFEDALNGIQAGMSSGIYTVGVSTYNPPSVLEPLCHKVIPDFTGLTSQDFDEILEAASIRE